MIPAAGAETPGRAIGSAPAAAPLPSSEAPMTRPIRPAALLVFLGALLGSQPAVAQTVRYVDNLRTCDGLAPCYSTIMDAVNAAASGDSIEVFPGVYHEAVVFSAKDRIVLKAHDEALRPVIAPS